MLLRLLIGFVSTVLVTSCGLQPSTSSIQTAIAKTHAAAITPTVAEPSATRTARPTNTPRPTSTPNIGTRGWPVPFGQKLSLIQDDGAQFTVQVMEVRRGEAANALVLKSNSFNPEPTAGMEYMLIKVEVRHTGDDSGVVTVDTGYWASVSNGQVYGNGNVFGSHVCCLTDVGLEEFNETTLFAGARATGWVALPVHKDDNEPLLAGWIQPDGTGWFFALPEPKAFPPTATPSPVPALGATGDCGNLWRLGTFVEPDFESTFVDEPAKGAYAKVLFHIENLQGQTAYLNPFLEKLEMVGEVSGRTVAFEATDYGPSFSEEAEGLAAWTDDVPPGLEVTAMAIFDVNPNGTNWRLRLTMDTSTRGRCTVELGLVP
jgi:hypothetical protein